MYRTPIAFLAAVVSEGLADIEQIQTAVADTDTMAEAAELVYFQITDGPIDAADREALARVEAVAQ